MFNARTTYLPSMENIDAVPVCTVLTFALLKHFQLNLQNILPFENSLESITVFQKFMLTALNSKKKMQQSLLF